MTTKSEQLFSQAVKVLPGGVSRNTIFFFQQEGCTEKGHG